MPKTIQMIHVEVTDGFDNDGTALLTVRFQDWDGVWREGLLDAEDVIELTEERATLCRGCETGGDPDEHDEESYEERQWVSEWEPVDEVGEVPRDEL